MKRKAVVSVLVMLYAFVFVQMLRLESFIADTNVISSVTTVGSITPPKAGITSFAFPSQGVNIIGSASSGSGLSLLQRTFSRLKTQSNREFWKVFRGRAQIKGIFDNSILIFKGSIPLLGVKYSSIIFYLRRLRL